MNPTEPVRDTMRRTLLNLRFIEERAAADGPYEVTQLVNSFLCALAHPWERLQTELMAMPLSEAERRGWPKIEKERSTDQDPNSLGDLIRLVRNSFAHGNVEFQSGQDGDVRGIRFWNLRQGRRTWGASLGTTELRRFLECFVGLADELHQSRTGADKTET